MTWLSLILAVLAVATLCIIVWFRRAYGWRKRLRYDVDWVLRAHDLQHAGAGRVGDGDIAVRSALVLLRFSNAGIGSIAVGDYDGADDRTGISVWFPGRRVMDFEVFAVSSEPTAAILGPDGGAAIRGGVLELPRVPLSRSGYFEVVAVVESASEAPAQDQFSLVVNGGVKGRAHVEAQETGIDRGVVALGSFLTVIVIIQFGLQLLR